MLLVSKKDLFILCPSFKYLIRIFFFLNDSTGLPKMFMCVCQTTPRGKSLPILHVIMVFCLWSDNYIIGMNANAYDSKESDHVILVLYCVNIIQTRFFFQVPIF